MAAEYEALQRQREEELLAIVGTPAETVDAFRANAAVDVAKREEAAPRASQESRGPVCRCREMETTTEPTILGPSGQRFVIRQTKAGNTYGRAGQVVLVTNGRHAIERSNVRESREAVVDRLTVSLRARAEAVENARAVVPETERPKLDAMLVRWFKRPGTWRGARERIARCLRYMNLHEDAERRAMKALNTMALRGTWVT